LTKADERLDDNGRTKLVGLLDAGDPHGEVRMAWHAKEVVRSIDDHLDPGLALEFVTRLGHDLQVGPGYPAPCAAKEAGSSSPPPPKVHEGWGSCGKDLWCADSARHRPARRRRRDRQHG
jgi:hypothetical protein